ncbi:MAG: AMP-binding protein, partial [Crocinitomix sp.]|nr:AMP-binding protein [Crocinitomix sp.]
MDKRVIHSVFENIVSEYPNSIALSHSKGEVTYATLNKKANRIADLLVKRGLIKGDVVSVFFEDRLQQLEVVIGTFKSGGIYLPLDSKYREKHWGVLFENIQPKFIVLSEDKKADFEALNSKFEYTIPELIIYSNENENIRTYSIKEGAYVPNDPLEFLSEN